MSRLEAPSEPSMEEILAQIRKIIADEPLQARAEHAQLAAQRRTQPPRPQQMSQTTPEPPQQAPAPAFEAIARLESVLNSPISHADDDLSDLVEPVAQEPLALPAQQPVTLEPAHEPTQHLAAVEPIAEAASAAPVIVDAAAPSESVPASASVSEPEAAPIAEVPAKVEPVADAMETALDTLAAGLAAVSVKANLDSPAESSPAAVAAELPAPAESAPAVAAAEEAPAPAAIEVVAVVSDAPTDPEPEVPLSDQVDVTASLSASAQADPEPSLPAVVEAPAVEPEQPVAESHDAVPPVVSDPPPQPAQAAYAAVMAPAAPALAAEAADPSSNAAGTGAEDASSNLDDTMADLLRPMLRQWLDENMPRIVERALRVEMAQMRKPKK